MSHDTILIAAWSGRMLAASARRAGYCPLVADAFGDSDTRDLVAAIEVLPQAFTEGFKASTLILALDRLAAAAPTPPVGLVLGTGFEECPKLVDELAKRWRLIGCGADAITLAKSPDTFFGLLAELGIPHPETRLEAPPSGEGWLTRRIGGSGGTHIAVCRPHVAAHADRYFQRRLTGEPVSISGIVGRRGYGLGFTRQWVSPMPRRPYRWGGAAGPIALDPDAEARMIDTVVALTPRLGLVGLVSFDFLLVDGEPLLLEVNPRPGASLDVLDDASGSLFRAHVEACLAPDSSEPLAIAPPADETRAIAYVYADPGPVRVPAIEWPDWAADRPLAGTVLPQYAPLATVIANGRDSENALSICRHRAQQLQQMIYGTSQGKETNQ